MTAPSTTRASIRRWIGARALPSDEVEQARTAGAVVFALLAALVAGSVAAGVVLWATRSLVWTLTSGAAAGLVVSPIAALGGDLGVLVEVGLDGFHHHLDAEPRRDRAKRWTVTLAVGVLVGAGALFLLPCVLVVAVPWPLPREIALRWARLASSIGSWWEARRHRREHLVLGPYRTPGDVPVATPLPASQSPSGRSARVLEAVGTALVWLTVLACMGAEGWFWISALRE
ncbi:MAG: hypothetical protein IT379_42125 [Deltaproteobacteria bacterium]|nr:hypothetical protein [Deltaproteobacteria bacterium]